MERAKSDPSLRSHRKITQGGQDDGLDEKSKGARNLDFEGFFGVGEFVAFAGYPDVHGWEEENAHDQGGDQAADDYDGEGALGIRADRAAGGGGKEAQGGDQHGHHDGAEDGAFDGGIFDGMVVGAELVDVLEHDDAGLDGDAEEREEADAGGDAEVRAGEEQCGQAAEGGDGYVRQGP